MSLVVETGAIVANANSYNTEAEIVAYAAIYGVTITTAEAEQYVLRNRAYFDTLVYQGDQVEFGVQALPWPRDYVYIEGNLLDNDAIPALLKKAEQEAALLVAQGYDLQATVTQADNVKEESFAVFKTVYQDNKVTSNIYPRLDSYLAPLLESGGGGYNFRLERSYG